MDAPLPSLAISTTPPPHGALLAELSLSLGAFALGTGEFASMGLLPDVSRTIGVDIPTGGHMISAYALGVVIGSPILAVIFARAPRRALLVYLMLFFALGNVATAIANSYGFVLAGRFIAGVPHGAYFGVAMLVAASLVPPGKRAQAVARVLLGLSIANVIGVPLATRLGQVVGWRVAFLIVAALGVATAIACRFTLAPLPALEGASPRTELRGLKNVEMWLTLGIAAIGFGGLFAVYSYITPTVVNVAHRSEADVGLVLTACGVGMVLGGMFGGWLADRGIMRAVGISIVLDAFALAIFPWLAPSYPLLVFAMFFIAFAGFGMGPALQTRLMDVAGEAQTIAAALNHSAFNAANALGAWIGGVAIARGMGWTSTGPIGAGLAVAGGVVYVIAVYVARARLRTAR